MPAAARLSEAQRFAIRFFAILAAASVAAWAVRLPVHLGGVQRFLAVSAGWIARLAGGNNDVEQDHISTGGLIVHINFECTGIYVLLILFTFLLAYPATWRARLLGIAVGTAALTLINILRITFLLRVAELQPQLFAYLHEYVWQGVFLVLVIAYAMSWVEHAR